MSEFSWEKSPHLQGLKRWCAVGDSLTQGGWYHHYIHLYFATRFPRCRLEILNCGVNGDTALKVLTRLERDVLSHRPDTVSILLGMNDVGRSLYERGIYTDETRGARAKLLKEFRTNIRSLLVRLGEAGVNTILATPTIYDEGLVDKHAEPTCVGLNDALAEYAEICRALAREFSTGAVDLYGPMARISSERQLADPSFTLIGTDRVHPAEVGHFVMAYYFLKSLGVPPSVAQIAIKKKDSVPDGLSGCAVFNVRRRSESIEFDCLEEALPFPAASACERAFALVEFTNDLNQEVLQIDSLAPGEYALWIDEVFINTFSNEQLSLGVNLALESATPQYQQAKEVSDLLTERWSLYSGRLRCIAEMEWGFLSERALDLGDSLACGAALLAEIEREKNSPWYAYYAKQASAYVENKGNESDYLSRTTEIMDKVWLKNVPVAHHYVLHRR